MVNSKSEFKKVTLWTRQNIKSLDEIREKGRYKVERKTSFSLSFTNSMPRFTGHQRDRQAYPPDSLGDK